LQVKLESAAEETTALQEQESLSLKQLEADGKALATLTATDKKSGLGGRTLITFERFRGGVLSLLPAHRMSNGDIVALRDTSAAGPASKQQASDHRGLIYKATEAKLVIAVRRSISHHGSLLLRARELLCCARIRANVLPILSRSLSLS